MRRPARPPLALRRLAALHGVAAEYRDANGERALVSTESLLGVLGALGVELASPAAAPAATTAELRRRQASLLEPVQVQRGALAPVIEFANRRALRAAGASLRVELEGGGSYSTPLRALEELDSRGNRRRVRLQGPLPVGYHRVRLEAHGLEAAATLLVAPRRLPESERSWGLFLPLYALRRAGDLGIGDLGGLEAIRHLVTELGGSYFATLPLHAQYYDEPFEPSPYLPVSRLAWNELYLDLAHLLRESGDREATELYAQLDAEARRSGRDTARLVAYEGASQSRRPLLTRLAELAATEPHSAGAIATFFEAHRELAAYCEFRAAREAGEGTAGTALAYHRFVQFATAQQLHAAKASGAALLLDLPLGVHPLGFDTWYFGSSFASGAAVGAPPDDFQVAGQNWGFPPLHPEGQRADAYAYLRACYGAVLEHAGALRIDHVMGLERLWWVPCGAAADAGAYVYTRLEEQRAVLAIEASRAGAPILGEDLGTVSDAIERAMNEDGLLHSAVLQFLLRPDGPLPKLPKHAVGSIGTHDLPKFAAYWKGLDIIERAERDMIPAELAARQLAERREVRTHVARLLDLPSEVGSGRVTPPSAGPVAGEWTCTPTATAAALAGLVEHLGKSDAEIALVDLEDCWLEEEPINRPGSPSSEGNWRRRAVRTLEEVAADEELARIFATLGASRSRPQAGLAAGGLTRAGDPS